MKPLNITIAFFFFVVSNLFAQYPTMINKGTGDEIWLMPGEKATFVWMEKHKVVEATGEVLFVSNETMYFQAENEKKAIPISKILAFQTKTMKTAYETSAKRSGWGIPLLLIGMTSEKFWNDLADEVAGRVEINKVKEAYKDKNFELFDYWEFEKPRPEKDAMVINPFE
ncbi:hypothetical protein R9C00_12695 [Flammeovirgaceae bacterium SG7u.111]|nr:hypothetical protein [Flammeovirgaceae bacterium SG7u.132]WPO38312.1 hypothetical protein R9C00_12695 [Flammeovirgaceae bacterium SG7u.111]